MVIHTLVKFSLSLAAALGLYLLVDVDPQLRIGLSLFTLIALLWLSETFHITVTALLVPLITILADIFTPAEAFRQFANPVIFLFLGGFALAAVMRKQGLDRFIAHHLVKLARGDNRHAVLLLFGVTALLSMWISNTATTAMMIPLALGLLADTRYEDNQSSYWFVLLGVAYSANIGGIGTLVGSPPNAIAAANADIRFVEWLLVGLPVALISLPLIIALLWLFFRPRLPALTTSSDETPQRLARQQKLTLSVFGLTVLLWLSSQPLAYLLGVEKGFDSLVAILAIALITIPGLAQWKDIERTADWGVLLLFGGGLTLSAMMQTTGTSLFLADAIVGLFREAPLYVLLLAITFLIVMLTEFTSNTASSALLIPVFLSVCASMDLPPALIAMLIAIGASCAFMLPVATPPNAIVYGSGFVPQRQMMKIGLWVNLVMIVLLTTGAWFLLQ